jgi:hypothetical protein
MGNPTRTSVPDEWEAVDLGSDPGPPGSLDEPSTLGTMLYMLLSLGTGILYFTWAIVGLSVSIPLIVVLVGIPLLMMFLMSIRLVGVLEGWLIEGLVGVRMTPPRSGSTLDLAHDDRGLLGAFLDRRTWSTLVYMILMLPLSVAYFVFVVVGITVPLALIGGSIGELLTGRDVVHLPIGQVEDAGPLALIGVSAIGVAVLMLVWHLIRGIGLLHARFARSMLVQE